MRSEDKYSEGQRYVDGYPRANFSLKRDGQVNTRTPKDGQGAVIAVDGATGEKKWLDFADVTDAGILTTSTYLVFTGNCEEHFLALDAGTGEVFWKTSLGGASGDGPVS